MITILDGEDIVASRQKLTELTTKDVRYIDGKKQTVEDVSDLLAAGSLFGGDRTIIIENYLKIKTTDKLFEILKNYIDEAQTKIILWDTAVSKSKKLGDKKIIHLSFLFPKYFYVFLDGLIPGKSSENIKLAHEILKNMAPEQLLFSLTKRIRHLLYVKTGGAAGFLDVKNMAPWQISKLENQARNWPEDDLKSIYEKLSEVDEALKSGGLALPLTKHLDILISSALN